MGRIKVTCRRRLIKRKVIVNNKKPENIFLACNNNSYGVLTRSARLRCCQKLQQQQQTQNVQQTETTTTTQTTTTMMMMSEQQRCRLLELPVEIQLKIMGYLGCRDLETLKCTSKRLESIALHPSLWKEYEILDEKTTPSEITSNLKRMSLLKKVVIQNRIDTNNIVRQLSLTNKNLEELHITYKFYMPGGIPMYLRAALMTRLVERCQRLHTINFDGVYCRSLKLYRLLGKKVFGNLRSLHVKMTMGQIRAFVSHLNEQSRDNVNKSLRELGPRYWKVVRYLRCSDFRSIHKPNTH